MSVKSCAILQFDVAPRRAYLRSRIGDWGRSRMDRVEGSPARPCGLTPASAGLVRGACGGQAPFADRSPCWSALAARRRFGARLGSRPRRFMPASASVAAPGRRGWRRFCAAVVATELAAATLIARNARLLCLAQRYRPPPLRRAAGADDAAGRRSSRPPSPGSATTASPARAAQAVSRGAHRPAAAFPAALSALRISPALRDFFARCRRLAADPVAARRGHGHEA